MIHLKRLGSGVFILAMALVFAAIGGIVIALVALALPGLLVAALVLSFVYALGYIARDERD